VAEVAEVEDLQATEAAGVAEVEDPQAAEVEVEEAFPLFNHSHHWGHQEDKRGMLNQWDSSLPSSMETEPNQKGSLTY
jgi:hypothetical protein